MAKKDPAKLVKVGLGFLGISAEWEADPAERKAAWSLYVELVTRIATQPLATDEGLFREAFDSLYSLFDTTREILRDAGPDVGASNKSVGGIAIAVLNERLRPFLSRWHPVLVDDEAGRPKDASNRDHDNAWEQADHCRNELAKLRQDLEEYARALADIAGVR